MERTEFATDFFVDPKASVKSVFQGIGFLEELKVVVDVVQTKAK